LQWLCQSSQFTDKIKEAGWADQLISAEGTVDYCNRVARFMGGAEKTSQFLRLFMAPGVGHCGGGSGPAPSGQQEALLAWVEEGKAPETLSATRRILFE